MVSLSPSAMSWPFNTLSLAILLITSINTLLVAVLIWKILLSVMEVMAVGFCEREYSSAPRVVGCINFSVCGWRIIRIDKVGVVGRRLVGQHQVLPSQLLPLQIAPRIWGRRLRLQVLIEMPPVGAQILPSQA